MRNAPAAAGATASTSRPGSGNTRLGNPVDPDMPWTVTPHTVHMPDMAWTAGLVTCDPVAMSVTDPLLVVRRHVDLLRVHSAICRDAR